MKLDDYSWYTSLVPGIPARAAADEAFDSCRVRCIAHWSRFVWRGTIVIVQGGRYPEAEWVNNS